MLKAKQKKAIELLADGCSQVEAARCLGITPATLSGWKRKNEQFRRALEAVGRRNPAEFESLGRECLFAVMRELKKRLHRDDIQEIDVKTLLTVIDRVGKCTFTPSRTVGGDFRRTGQAAPSETDVSVSKSEESLLELLNDDIRKKLYELIARHLDAAAKDGSSR